MILLPKITKIEGGAATLESPEFSLSNYHTLGFLFENAASAKLTVKVTARAEDGGSPAGGAAKAVPFLLKPADADELENIGAEGKTIEGAGAFLAVITDRMLAHDEYDRAALSLTTDTGEVGTVYAIQDKPRYRDNE